MMAEGALGAFRTCKERLLFPDCSHARTVGSHHRKSLPVTSFAVLLDRDTMVRPAPQITVCPLFAPNRTTGKQVSIRYKPGKPERSVMVDGPELQPEPVILKTDLNV